MKHLSTFQKNNNLLVDGVLGKNTFESFKKKFVLNDLELAHFLGQVDKETGGFSKDTESLNYSPEGLIATFSYYRDRKTEAWIDGRTKLSRANQEVIANKVYADKNRGAKFKLGNTIHGDGFRFIGRGALQLTGRNNYTSFSKYLNDPEIIVNPDLVATKYFWESAMFFFLRNNLFKLCTSISTSQINKVTAVINKGTDSYQDRVNLVREYYELTK
jgi:putative chitinase